MNIRFKESFIYARLSLLLRLVHFVNSINKRTIESRQLMSNINLYK